MPNARTKAGFDARRGQNMKNVKCKKCANFKHDWCEKVIDSPDPELVRDCKHYWTLTNGRRIRNMEDEELAFWIHQTRHNPLEDRTISEWLVWLGREVSEDAEVH